MKQQSLNSALSLGDLLVNGFINYEKYFEAMSHLVNEDGMNYLINTEDSLSTIRASVVSYLV